MNYMLSMQVAQGICHLIDVLFGKQVNGKISAAKSLFLSSLAVRLTRLDFFSLNLLSF